VAILVLLKRRIGVKARQDDMTSKKHWNLKCSYKVTATRQVRFTGWLEPELHRRVH